MKDELLKPLSLASQEEWRRWLQDHGRQEREAWLTIRRKGAGKAGVPYEEAVEEALCFGWIDGKMRSYNAETFLLRFSPRKRDSVWSQSNKEKAQALIRAGRMSEAGLAAIEQAKRSGRWSAAYTSRVKPALPPDLEEALALKPAAFKNFVQMTNSAQTMYVVWVEQARRAETRRRRIEQVVARALKNKRPGD